jgi:hypothetical protein
MRRLISSFAVVAAVAATPAPGIAAEAFAVPIDQSASISLPRGAQNVMVGNPAIADVNILDTHTAVLLGRSYGVTNLVVLDVRGRTLLNRDIVVSAADTGRVSIVRGGLTGARTENYACSPRCERTPMPGETDLDFNRYAPGYSGYAARATEGRTAGGAKVGP